MLRRELEAGLAIVTADLTEILSKRENDLVLFGRAAAVQDFLRERDQQPLLSPVQGSPPDDLKIKLALVLNDRTHFVNLVIYDRHRQPLLLVKPEPGKQDLSFHVKDFPPGLPKPDDRSFPSPVPPAVHSALSVTSEGAISTLTVPVWVSGAADQEPLGFLVAEQNLDSLFSDAAKRWDLTPLSKARSGHQHSRGVVVLDNSGRILYHPNQALLHQPVANAMPYFMPAAQRMLSGQSGLQSFTSATGDESEAAYAAFPSLNISVASTQSAQLVLAATRWTAWWGLINAVAIGFIAALILTRYWQRKSRGIERLTEGVAEIAKGRLDHRLEVPSSVDMRPLAADVNLLTAQLREQVAREAEAQQFQSFVRLSAMLTHDLKNAIEALSLIVGNMERHFDDEDFRADAMKSLNLATQNLKALVTKLSNPVSTLSGEYKRPQPVDLVPMLKRAIAITAAPLSGTHRIEGRLPPSLFALVDAERISKVIENLILNALEAMSETSGSLTIEAGTIDESKVFFSVTDTGTGMARDFVEKRLYHPFATTKKMGVGLGLYTCREVVRAHGGNIEVDSTEGSGTTFRVVLPSAQAVKSSSG